MHQFQELGTPTQTPQAYGATSCVRWLTNPYEQYETLCFGTALGYLVFWRQDTRGKFSEFFIKRLGDGKEILDITLDTPNKEYTRFAVGTLCRSIQIWKYDCNGLLNVLRSLSVGKTIPRKVVFDYHENILRVFGFYDGCMYVETFSWI